MRAKFRNFWSRFELISIFFLEKTTVSVWNCRTSNFCWTSYFCLLLVSISVLLFSVLRSQCFKLSLINPTVILSHIAKCDLSGVEVGNWDIWQVLSKTFDCLSFNLPLVAVWIGYSYLELILQSRYIDAEELGFSIQSSQKVCPSTLVVCQSCQWVVVRQFSSWWFSCADWQTGIFTREFLRSWPEILWGLHVSVTSDGATLQAYSDIQYQVLWCCWAHIVWDAFRSLDWIWVSVHSATGLPRTRLHRKRARCPAWLHPWSKTAYIE